VGGGRAPKDSPVIEAGGDLDELSALLGVVRAHPLPGEVDAALQTIQEKLLLIGIAIATPEGVDAGVVKIGGDDIRHLEEQIDTYDAGLPPLTRFILPGGAAAGAHLHLARAVARRIERRCVTLSRTRGVAPEAVRWLNRLSDLLFVMARYVNQTQSMPEKSSDCLRGK
jgi:cob(I)alamin adenosyltransferase